MTKPLRRILLSLILTAVFAAPANAKTVQVETLTAMAKMQTWESAEVSEDPPVYVWIYYRGHPIRQESRNSCSAIYTGHGITIRLRVAENCGQPGPGHYVIRYASYGRPKPFTIRLAT